MKTNEIPNNELIKRDIPILLNQCKKHRDDKEELLQQVNKSIKYLQSHQSYKRSEMYMLNKEGETTAELNELESEIKGIESGVHQLKKVKALLKSYGL
jgi:predicted  nucleic acid-binding Zn-ribbon protein